MKNLEIVTMNVEDVQAYIPTRPYEICISIRDPGAPPRLISNKFTAVLRLELHDIEAEHAGLLVEPGEMATPLSDVDAFRAVEFVGTHFTAADRLVVHCDAGISRSVSMAHAIADQFNTRILNWTVYSRMARAYRMWLKVENTKDPREYIRRSADYPKRYGVDTL